MKRRERVERMCIGLTEFMSSTSICCAATCQTLRYSGNLGDTIFVLKSNDEDFQAFGGTAQWTMVLATGGEIDMSKTKGPGREVFLQAISTPPEISRYPCSCI